MPVYHVLIVLTIPRPLNSRPEFSDTINKVVPNGVGGAQILPKREQSLHEERGLHKITAIVFLTERDHLASASVYPVRPCTMKPVGFLQEGHELIEMLNAVVAWNEVSFSANNHRHNAEAGSARRYGVA